MPTYEGLRLKVLKVRRNLFADILRKGLENTDFTIISNNCWGGMVYESYNLPKQSPTVGLFFMASDYILFVSDLKEYLSADLTFIRPQESKWKEEFEQSESFGSYPIGKIKDVEIFFLHYHSEEEALSKWKRRCQRINWDRMLIKFNDQNGCTERELDCFMKLPYKNKLFLTCKSWSGYSRTDYVKLRQMVKSDFVMASYEPFGKSRKLDVTALINSL